MKARLLLALVWIVLAGCDKRDSQSATGPTTSPDEGGGAASAQYGTPYDQGPDAKDAIIYQVNIRAFSREGNFAGVQARLDAIRELGVNVLYLMPIYPIGVLKTVNSPYCIKDYTGVNAEFGTLADLRALVAEAHKRNMAVLLDWVADHTSWDNSWIDHKAWYKQDQAGNIIAPIAEWKDVAALDFNNAEMRQAMIKAMKYWIYQANIDGYRCDASDFVPFDFWHQAIDDLRAIPGHKLLLFAEGTRKDNFAAGFQLKYGMGFYQNLKKVYAGKESVRSIDFLNKEEYANAPAGDQVVRYITNHDVNQSDGTPLEVLGGEPGSLAAFVVAAYMKGVPMIYNGQEVGCPVKLSFFNHNTVIDWKLNPDMAEQYGKIINLRNKSEALKQGALLSFGNDDVCAFTKSFEGEEVLVIVNMRNSAGSFTPPPELVRTEWKNAFGETDSTLSGEVALQPYQYQVFKKQ